MQVATLLLSEGVSVDVFTGRVTPFNLVETLFAPRFPARVTRLHVLVQYERNVDEAADRFVSKMELLDPTGTDIRSAPAQEIALATRFHSSIHNAWNLKLPEAGDYVLRVSRSDSADGPWTELRRRAVVVETALHPLLSPDAAAKES
jgi:hypothetical protein